MSLIKFIKNWADKEGDSYSLQATIPEIVPELPQLKNKNLQKTAEVMFSCNIKDGLSARLYNELVIPDLTMLSLNEIPLSSLLFLFIAMINMIELPAWLIYSFVNLRIFSEMNTHIDCINLVTEMNVQTRDGTTIFTINPFPDILNLNDLGLTLRVPDNSPFTILQSALDSHGNYEECFGVEVGTPYDVADCIMEDYYADDNSHTTYSEATKNLLRYLSNFILDATNWNDGFHHGVFDAIQFGMTQDRYDWHGSFANLGIYPRLLN